MNQKNSNRQIGALPGKITGAGQTAAFFIMFIALLVMLPLRRKLGFRKLTYGALFGGAFVLYLLDSLSGLRITLFGGVVHSGGHGLLTYYGLGFLILGLWERHRRWAELKRGEFWHTYSHGISYLEFLPLRRDWIYRNMDPAIAFLAGLWLRNLGFALLGIVVMTSAVCFRIVEEQVHQRQLEEDLDACDGIIEANTRAQMMQRADAQPASPHSMRETGGISTGADAGLAEQIAKRRKQAERPDGLASPDTGVYQ